MVGACHNDSGSCVFEALPDGTPCAGLLEPDADDGGTCRDGVCHRQSMDTCSNRTCAVQSQCFETLACTVASGGCVSRPKLEGTPCNDGDPSTHSDRCIEGRCVGDPIVRPKFARLNEEACREVTSKASRYFADVPDVEDCKEQCRLDPECTAFTYGYHVCSVFGTLRITSPRPAAQDAQWMLEAASAVSTQYKLACFQKTSKDPMQTVLAERTLLALTICLLTVLPMLCLLAVNARPLYKSCRRLCDGGGTPPGEASSQLVKEGRGSIVVTDSPVVPIVDGLQAVDGCPTSEAKRIEESRSHDEQLMPAVTLPTDPRGEVQVARAFQ
eukprot:CAMPEP_0172770406 /NCGR_PEP_ID=MMETSP1074-20121228/188545_1 /TAXON_ID=2916 /ORGANISM="Ceratium fusus, Strain PA161109" /LENGTH=327 /DNA_ID=CAMNT_0013606161 /DNA_START=121 /DNA_END=1104 /DNA_ORIENTATION=-